MTLHAWLLSYEGREFFSSLKRALPGSEWECEVI